VQPTVPLGDVLAARLTDEALHAPAAEPDR
jgi:hypothetical protein